jgi:hypothetical protein
VFLAILEKRVRAFRAQAAQLQVSLLDSGATARVTEIAAKSLANLGSAPNNRTGIRLAGGIPPLVALLVEQPTPQVSFLVLWSGHPGMDASTDST